MDFDDAEEFDVPRVLDSKGTSLGGMDFHNPKSYVDTSFFDGLVELRNVICLKVRLIFYWPL